MSASCGNQPLRFDYDDERDVLTIEGVAYAGGLFRTLGLAPVGAKIEIVAREDDVLTVRLLR
jgi:hypothetical protein